MTTPPCQVLIPSLRDFYHHYVPNVDEVIWHAKAQKVVRERVRYHPYIAKQISLIRQRSIMGRDSNLYGVPRALAYISAVYGWSSQSGFFEALRYFGFGPLVDTEQKRRILFSYRLAYDLVPAYYPGCVLSSICPIYEEGRVILSALRANKIIVYPIRIPYRNAMMKMHSFSRASGAWLWDIHLYQYARSLFDPDFDLPTIINRGAIYPDLDFLTTPGMTDGIIGSMDWDQVERAGLALPPGI